MPAQRLFLLDGMALAYRAHFALIRSPIFNTKGINTSALFGFSNTLLTIIENQKPTHLAVAFDTSAATPRHEIFPEYKAHREEMPEDLRIALPNIKRLCQAMQIPILEIDGYEADDIIGTLAHRAEQEGDFETFMVTPDKDFAQLISPTTSMWKPGRKGSDHEVIGMERFKEIWEVETPAQVIDILGLMGDAADNIPGVPGVGEKTAKKLVQQFGSVENLLEHTDQLKGKQKEKVEANAEQARLSKHLATIMLDVPVPEALADFTVRGPDEEAVKSLFTEFEFNSLGKRLFGKDFVAGRGKNVESSPESDGDGGHLTAKLKTIADTKPHYTLVDSAKARKTLFASLSKQSSFCFDVETTALDRFEARLLGIAFSWKSGEGWYLPLLDLESVRADLATLLAGPAEKVGHNLKFDLAILLNHGFEVQGSFFDTLLAHTILAPEQKHSMDFLAESLLGYQTIKLADLHQESGDADDLFAHAAKKQALDMEAIPLAELAQYAAEDADVTWQLAESLRPQITEHGQDRVFYEIESPLLPILVEIEHEGIALDQTVLAASGKILQERIDTLSQGIKEEVGHDFNLNSPKQLGQILFEELQLVEKPKKTKTGQFKTDEQTLSALAPKHAIVQKILAYREAAKLKSTYVDALPGHVVAKTGRIHTHFHQLVAATGRLASSDPNIQNIPVRSEAGRELRKAFVARDKHHLLLSADYSQVELRIMAAMSGDPGMIEAFRQDLDIHTATAAKVYGVALDEVLPEMRATAKMVNFGIIYGISAFGLSQRLGIPRQEASEIIETYFEKYPGVKEFMDRTIAQTKEQGYIETLTGRRRYLRDIGSSNATVRGNAERAAINTPIQGTAADMIKIAMIRVQAFLDPEKHKTRMLLQIHDELIFDLHEDEAATLPGEIVTLMESALPLPNDVPIRVDSGTGHNWLEAH